MEAGLCGHYGGVCVDSLEETKESEKSTAGIIVNTVENEY